MEQICNDRILFMVLKVTNNVNVNNVVIMLCFYSFCKIVNESFSMLLKHFFFWRYVCHR